MKVKGYQGRSSTGMAISSWFNGWLRGPCGGGTRFWMRWKPAKPRGIYEQVRVRPLGGQGAPEPGRHVAGEEAPLEVVVEEAGCKFSVDVTAPLGVGFYPDLRLGRDLVAGYAKSRRVLNLFSYTGAFSVRAAAAGASSVLAIDLAAKVHAKARRNYELSGLDPATMEQETADVPTCLAQLADRQRTFDLIVCDPRHFLMGWVPVVRSQSGGTSRNWQWVA